MPHRKLPVRFITFTGRPYSGKSTVLKKVLEARPDLEIFQGRSVTTREFRAGDVPGEYEHVTRERFEELVKLGEFLWTFEHGDYRLGTRKDDVDIALNRKDGNISVMTLVPEAVSRLRSSAVGTARVVSFFVEAPDEDLYARIIERGDPLEEAEKRLEETRLWTMDRMKHLGIDPFLVRNSTESPPGHSATTFVLYQLERLVI